MAANMKAVKLRIKSVESTMQITAQNETPYQEAVFISSDYPSNNSYGITSEYFPQGIFYYRSTTGLEDYYSYHEQDAV